MKNIFSFSVYFWNTGTVYPSTSEIGNSKLYSNRRNIASPRARIRCITLSRSTFIFSFSSLLPAREMREVKFGAAFAFHGSSRVSRIFPSSRVYTLRCYFWAPKFKVPLHRTRRRRCRRWNRRASGWPPSILFALSCRWRSHAYTRVRASALLWYQYARRAPPRTGQWQSKVTSSAPRAFGMRSRRTRTSVLAREWQRPRFPAICPRNLMPRVISKYITMQMRRELIVSFLY